MSKKKILIKIALSPEFLEHASDVAREKFWTSPRPWDKVRQAKLFDLVAKKKRVGIEIKKIDDILAKLK